MCGIAGFTIFSDTYAARCQIERMVGMMAHRGPDAASCYVDDAVLLGARRLRIMDLAQGDQPFMNETKTVVAVFNGEIYNDQALRALLLAHGHALTSTCDGELLVHLYEEFGPDYVSKLDGMFAIALWDKRQQTLLVSVDPAGIKPLYYLHPIPGRLAFASEIKALRALVSEPFAVSATSLEEYLLFKSIPAPHTPFSAVSKLCPGETLIWRAGTLQSCVHQICGKSEHHAAPGQPVYGHALEQMLSKEIRGTTRSHVLPVGCVVSGGLDSSFVLRAMSTTEAMPCPVFSVGYPGGLADDESAVARRICDEIGGTFHHVVVQPEAIPTLMERVLWHLDEPVQDPVTVPFFALMQAVRDIATVVLTGDGADEIFGGYARLRHWDQPDKADAHAAYIQELCPFSDAQLQALMGSSADALAARGEAADALDHVRNMRDAMRWEMRYRLPSYHLMRVDKLSMAWGVEARVPYLRPVIVSATCAFPDTALRRNGVEKSAFRDAVSPDLPAWLMRRVKKPFTFPITGWLRELLREWVHDRLLTPTSRVNEWLKPQAVRTLVEDHEKSKADYSQQIWSLLVLETFLRQAH